MKIKIKANSKLNLFLDLSSKMDDGYHSIYTVMQSVNLYDIITLETIEENNIILDCSKKNIPTDSRNTAYKAAEKYLKKASLDCGVKIYIEKKIPSQAGMGGGSADAAAVFFGLNEMFNKRFDEDEMLSLCNQVGSDVPFCYKGGLRLCLNRGEITAKLPPLKKGCYFTVVKPKDGVSTKQAYELYDKADGIRHPDREGFLKAAASGDFDLMTSKAENVFEQTVEISDRVKIKSVMRKNDSKISMMTGSGSVVYGLFENRENAESAFDELKQNFKNVWVCEPSRRGIEII